MALVISAGVRKKLSEKHQVTEGEIRQSFANRTGEYLEDLREEHRTDPPTRWFVARTDFGRFLKIAFIFEDGDVIIKSAFEPNANELRIYQKYGSKL